MEERYFEDGVRTRLILAGLDELCRHGVRDFSLRRVALAAQVSCAAPYRHFKDKDELILEIIRYIFSKWELLCREIESVFATDNAKLIAELAAANVSFWIANGNFRTVIMVSATLGDYGHGPMREFDRPIAEAVTRYAKEKGISDPDPLTFKLLSMIYGAVILVDGGYESGRIATRYGCRSVFEADRDGGDATYGGESLFYVSYATRTHHAFDF